MLQKERLLSILLRTPNQRVSCLDIVMESKILHHNSVIKELRSKGNKIENKKEMRKNSQGEWIQYSWFRLVIPTPTEKKTIKEKILDFIKNI